MVRLSKQSNQIILQMGMEIGGHTQVQPWGQSKFKKPMIWHTVNWWKTIWNGRPMSKSVLALISSWHDIHGLIFVDNDQQLGVPESLDWWDEIGAQRHFQSSNSTNIIMIKQHLWGFIEPFRLHLSYIKHTHTIASWYRLNIKINLTFRLTAVRATPFLCK